MFAYSALQAVSPAVRRTRDFLFRPFDWISFLKLSAVAVVTEGTLANFNYSHHSGSAATSGTLPGSSSLGWPGVLAIVFLVALALVIGIFLFYLVTRLRFAFFYCLVHQTREIRPGWKLYRTQAMRFFKLNLIIGFLMMGLVVLAVLPFLPGFLHLIRSRQQGVPFDFVSFFALLALFFAVCVILVLLCFAMDIILRDFMLPHIALEDASVREAWVAVRTRFSAEKGPFFLYLILRLVLPLIAGIALIIAALIPLAIIVGILAASVAGVTAMLAHASGLGVILLVSLDAAFGIAAIAGACFVAIGLGGPLGTAIRNYALLFYGGRYQMLGDILWPAPPPPQEPTAGTLETA